MSRSLSLFITLAATVLLIGAAGVSRAATQAAQPVPFDQQFIDMMVPHHEGALEMARIAEARSQRPEIREMAANILRTQAAEIEQMKTWRLAWYGSDQTPPMSQMPMVEGTTMEMPAGGGHGGHGGMVPAGSAVAPPSPTTMDMAADVERLRNAPEPFDLAFIDAMIAHHNDAVAAGRIAESRAEHPEIRELAQAIVRDQEQEVALLSQWRQEWFPG
jgi:uncharacterized protein (DUF305 family)